MCNAIRICMTSYCSDSLHELIDYNIFQTKEIEVYVSCLQGLTKHFDKITMIRRTALTIRLNVTMMNHSLLFP